MNHKNIVNISKMAKIDSAVPRNDGGGGCRTQRAPRIGDIQRHKAVEMDSTSTSESFEADILLSDLVDESTSIPETPTAQNICSSTNPKIAQQISGVVIEKQLVSGDGGTGFIEKTTNKNNPFLEQQIPDKFTDPTNTITQQTMEQANCETSSKSTKQTDNHRNNHCSKSSIKDETIDFNEKSCQSNCQILKNLQLDSVQAKPPTQNHTKIHTNCTKCKCKNNEKSQTQHKDTIINDKESQDLPKFKRDPTDDDIEDDDADDDDVHCLTSNTSRPQSSSGSCLNIEQPTSSCLRRCLQNSIQRKSDYYDEKLVTTDSQQTEMPSLITKLVDGSGRDSSSSSNTLNTDESDIVAGSSEGTSISGVSHVIIKPLMRALMMPKTQSIDSRPIYPNVPYSPYGSPFGSPRMNRKRPPLRESRRISIDKSGSFHQLNQYKLLDQIGQGSYGLVKLAYNEEDSTHYAMKILSKRRLLRKAGLMGRGPKKTTTSSPLDRVYREIAVLKKLDHPNVVKLIEVLDDPLEDSLYLAFELVQKGEILSIPTDNPLSAERAWSVFRDAIQGLEYLHYQRIIHADIKPGNLLLAECGRVKIADLGVCNEFIGEDATLNNGSTAGTPAFRAPETLILGQHLYSGKATDIWALGATLYSIIYGNVPFVATNVPAVYEKIKNEPLVFPDKPIITDDLRDLLIQILTKDPNQRITLPALKEHPWVTSNGQFPLPSEEENCRLVQISDEDINSVVKSIPKLDTLILIKTMLKNHSFQNPFARGGIGKRAPRFTRAGRSISAPGAYHLPPDRQLSIENILPALAENVLNSPCTENSPET